MVKDVKRSIRNKYDIRLTNLRIKLEDYIFHAEQRLDVNIAGKARNADSIRLIVEKAYELLKVLPEEKEVPLDSEFIMNSLENIGEWTLDPNEIIKGDKISNEQADDLYQEFLEINKDILGEIAKLDETK